MSDWLQKPFYPLPEPQVYVDSVINGWPPAMTTKTLTVECALQSELASVMSNILAWLNPEYHTFQTSRTLQSLMSDFINQALFRIMYYPSTGAGVDPVRLGMQYGKLQQSLMSQIDSGDGVTDLWTAWTSMTEPIK